MIVVDTSAWVEYLRATGSVADLALDAAVRDGDELGVPDVVRLELLAGAAESRLDDLRGLLARFIALPAASPADHELAAGAVPPVACGRTDGAFARRLPGRGSGPAPRRACAGAGPRLPGARRHQRTTTERERSCS